MEEDIIRDMEEKSKKINRNMRALRAALRKHRRRVIIPKKHHIVHRHNKKLFCKTLRICNKCCDRKKGKTICRSCCRNFKACNKTEKGLNERVKKIARFTSKPKNAFRVAQKTGVKCRTYTRYGCDGKRKPKKNNIDCKRKVRVCKKFVYSPNKYYKNLNKSIKKHKK